MATSLHRCGVLGALEQRACEREREVLFSLYCTEPSSSTRRLRGIIFFLPSERRSISSLSLSLAKKLFNPSRDPNGTPPAPALAFRRRLAAAENGPLRAPRFFLFFYTVGRNIPRGALERDGDLSFLKPTSLKSSSSSLPTSHRIASYISRLSVSFGLCPVRVRVRPRLGRNRSRQKLEREDEDGTTEDERGWGERERER